MISIIRGKIESVGKDSIIVMTGAGLGYKVACQPANLSTCQPNDEVILHTYLKVSDSALDLYGFEAPEEKEFFELLMTVSGVGPKAAMRVLSLGSMQEIQSAIARGDSKYLTAVQGMGKKTAERLCVELKNKVQTSDGRLQTSAGSKVIGEVIEALVSMGYSREDAKAAATALDSAEKTTEEMLRLALQQMK